MNSPPMCSIAVIPLIEWKQNAAIPTWDTEPLGSVDLGSCSQWSQTHTANSAELPQLPVRRNL